MPVYRAKMNFGPVTPELRLIYELLVRHSKMAYLVEYLRIYWTDFRNFSPYESTLGADDRYGPRFPICQGTLPWQPNNFGRNNERGLILPAFFALALKNELEYHNLYVRINSMMIRLHLI